MRIGYILFDGMTTLDFIGFYDAVGRLKTMNILPGVEETLLARSAEVRDDRGLAMRAGKTPATLAGWDMLFLPGGMGTRTLHKDTGFLAWLATAADCPLKVSVCTGALLWGAAGFLKGKRATTHPNAYGLLRPYCREVVENERVVDEGELVTGRGVSTSIDLGLHICRRLAGEEAKRKIQTQMDYPYGN